MKNHISRFARATKTLLLVAILLVALAIGCTRTVVVTATPEPTVTPTPTPAPTANAVPTPPPNPTLRTVPLVLMKPTYPPQQATFAPVPEYCKDPRAETYLNIANARFIEIEHYLVWLEEDLLLVTGDLQPMQTDPDAVYDQTFEAKTAPFIPLAVEEGKLLANMSPPSPLAAEVIEPFARVGEDVILFGEQAQQAAHEALATQGEVQKGMDQARVAVIQGCKH